MEILLAVAVIPNKISAARKILDLLCFPTRLYQSAPFVLFCVLALAASWQLEYIHTRIERLRFLNAHVDKAKNLKLLMREHVHICRSIQIFNNFFGFFLFVEVVFIFVGIINASMFVLVSSLIGHFDLAFVNGAIATDQFVRLFVMSYVSSAITKKVVTFNQVSFYESLSRFVFVRCRTQKYIMHWWNLPSNHLHWKTWYVLWRFTYFVNSN